MAIEIYSGLASVEAEWFTFPGGERHVKLKNDVGSSRYTILARVQSSVDFFDVALAHDALSRTGCRPRLVIPYFPYARQDRVMVPGEPLSVRVAANFINSLDFHEVVVYDPHSDVVPALLNNCRVITNHRFVRRVTQGQRLTLVSPDAGAAKKAHALARELPFDGLIECSKERELATGKIVGQHVHGDPEGKNCLIVDDICDGGRTFIELAKALRTKGARTVSLAVSHGIFSQGEQALHALDEVYCTDSYKVVESTFIHQYPIWENEHVA